MPTSTLSGEAERPQVAGAVIEAVRSIGFPPHGYSRNGVITSEVCPSLVIASVLLG